MRRRTLTLASAVALAAVPASAQAASLSLRPAIAAAGATVGAEGAGWRPGSGVVVRRAGGARLGAATVGPDGRFAVALRLPRNLGVRTHPVVAAGGGTRVQSRLRVVAVTRDWAPKEIAYGGGSPVRLALSRTVAFPTAPVRFDAAGLNPNDLVAARLRDGPTVSARADARGRASVVLTVPTTRLEGSTLTLRAGRTRRVEPFYVLPPQTTVPPLPPPARADPLLAAAGDIACNPNADRTADTCHEQQTSDTILAASPDAVAPLGDVQYERGSAEELPAYDRTWGRLRERSRPAVGNHEYGTPGAAAYFAYFGAPAGAPDRGYYSYDLGAWHVVVLNSNCGFVPCFVDSAQERWLRADLAAHPDPCTLAYWHHPRFSSAQREPGNVTVQPLWAALVQGGADVALTGHVHNYERLAPLDADGGVDRAQGMRSFVVGTGGRNHQTLAIRKPYSEAASIDTFGALLLTLKPSGYDWRFAAEAGAQFTDSGSGACR
ncbi:MAG: hypothetical protein QOE65_62 [Solirubrobacteraceae bacterium]|jgi:hypothetical protein|nr:hypothetical protein [Solirubrobacteraceae bacterium]